MTSIPHSALRNREATPVSILIYGKRPFLIETQEWNFQTRGYRVLTISTLEELRSIPRTQPIALLVLCHGLSSQERSMAVGRASSRWPGVRCLVLVPDTSLAPTGGLGQMFGTADRPGPVFSIVNEIVGRGMIPPQPYIH